jgi:hypothetical protein
VNRTRFGVLLALLFLLVLIASAPARLVGYVLPQDSIRVAGLSGSLWRGEASNAAIMTNSGWLQLGRTHWDLSPFYLLLLSPTVDIESSWGQQRLQARLRLFPSGTLRLSSVDASFSATLVRRWMPVDLRGDMNILLERMDIASGVPAEGTGRLVWRQAYWRGNRGSQRLGDYVLEFTIAAPGQGQASVSTLAGPIEVEGGLTVDGRKYAVDARLSSAERIDEELAGALQLMAEPVDGGYQLKFNSEF